VDLEGDGHVLFEGMTPHHSYTVQFSNSDWGKPL